MSVEEYDLPPDPERVMVGLRDTGYEFETAVADIVDNSIAANATKVQLFLNADFRGNIRLSIADNGDGIPVSIQPKLFDPFFKLIVYG